MAQADEVDGKMLMVRHCSREVSMNHSVRSDSNRLCLIVK